jgi:hypothetical protein
MDLKSDPAVTLVQVFNDDDVAQAAVQELKAVGFSESQIRVVAHDVQLPEESSSAETEVAEIAEGATAGAAAGFGIGALWGIGVLAGIAPDISPAIAGGAIGVLFSCAATGAATIGTVGALFGFGAHHEHVAHSRNQFDVHHTIVTVRAGTRAGIASSVLNHFNRVPVPTQTT